MFRLSLDNSGGRNNDSHPHHPGPGQLIVAGGQAATPPPSGGSSSQCIVSNQQSTPVNSVFPDPVTVQVNTLADQLGNIYAVPGAKVQITGRGLSPTITTVVTDANGFASFPLLANGIVQGPYQASIEVISPTPNASAAACALNVPYQLQNTPSVNGTVPTNPDVQAVVSVTGKSAVFTTDRLWNLSIIDPTRTATGGTLTGQLTRTRGSSTCNPVSVISDALQATTTAGKFTSYLGWDFSSCTGLNLFTLTVTGNFTIPLDEGGTYQASYSASTNNQTP